MLPISEEKAREAADRVARVLHPDRIILFGSLVWGQPNQDSDIDLLVIVPDSDQPPYRRAREAYRALHGLGVPVDILVATRQEVARAQQVASSLLKQALERGKVLHG